MYENNEPRCKKASKFIRFSIQAGIFSKEPQTLIICVVPTDATAKLTLKSEI